MSVTVKWDNEEKSALYIEALGHWTWSEYFPAAIEMGTMMREVPHTVYFILKIENPTYLPPNTLSQIMYLHRNWPSNGGFMVVVGSRLFVKTLLSTVAKINKSWGERYRFVETLEEARALIANEIAT